MRRLCLVVAAALIAAPRAFAGPLKGWGADGSGQLGDGTANGEAQAPALGLAHGLGSLVAGQGHTLGL
jgi:hypothetical protein